MGLPVIAFDLDGCLADTRQLIERAYRTAGAEPPEDFFSLGHHDWIEPDRREQVHAAKNAAYLEALAREPVTLLPPWQAAERLRAEGRAVALLTGAPEGTIKVLEKRVPSWPFLIARSAATPQEKTAWLARMRQGAYVDDQQYVTIPDGWRFVHWTGQDAGELYRQVTR